MDVNTIEAAQDHDTDRCGFEVGREGAVRPSARGPWPLNRDRPFRTWPPFDPGVYLDMNPSVVRRASGDCWVVFCRYPDPPQPGQGSIWAVETDAALKPVGRPTLLIAEGIDPRVVALADRVLVFYALLDRRQDGAIDGSCMVIQEFSLAGREWRALGGHRLPKFPLEGHRSAEAQSNWEKNWVPFPIDDDTVGLIYAHEPWDVITLETVAGRSPELKAVHRSPGLVWDYGTIRGGTPPVRYDDDHLITFFHAAQVVGSRRVYTAGACVFLAKPPYAPRLQTTTPLLIAPYRTDARRFGWTFAGSVVFPAGALHSRDGYDILSGLDDGEIGSIRVSRADLDERLAPVGSTSAGTLYDCRSGESLGAAPAGLLCVPDPMQGIADLPLINFARIVTGRGRTFVDVGAQVGAFAISLAPRFERTLAFEPSELHVWLERNRSFNGYRHVTCERFLPDRAAVTLDAIGPSDVDLLKIDVPGREIDILRGAVRLLQASAPNLLLKTALDRDVRAELEAFMAALDYSVEPLFPMTPAWVLCRPLPHRRALDWFLP